MDYCVNLFAAHLCIDLHYGFVGWWWHKAMGSAVSTTSAAVHAINDFCYVNLFLVKA